MANEFEKKVGDERCDVLGACVARRKRPGSAVKRGDLDAELKRIAAMDTSALRAIWLDMMGRSPTRQLSGDLLRRMVMHQVQERCLGGLDRKLTTTLDRLAENGGSPPRRLKLGSVFVREHAGIMHQVMVVEYGFAWNGLVLPSLSAAAKAITGTKWNGNRFFGLQKSFAAQVCPLDGHLSGKSLGTDIDSTASDEMRM